MTVNVTEQTFEKAISVPGLVIVDFWAPWCGPCRALAPTLEALDTEYAGRLTVAKCNVDDDENLAANCGVRNIPTLLFYKDGALVDRQAGASSLTELKAKIETLL